MTVHLFSTNSDHTYSSTCCLFNLSECLEICLCRQSYPRGWQTVVCGLNSAHTHCVNRVLQNTVTFTFQASSWAASTCGSRSRVKLPQQRPAKSPGPLLPAPLQKELADPQSGLCGISSKFHLANIQYFIDGYLFSSFKFLCITNNAAMSSYQGFWRVLRTLLKCRSVSSLRNAPKYG